MNGAGNPCYYEYISTPNDLTFQIPFSGLILGSSIVIEVLNPSDGSVEGVITSLFSITSTFGGNLTFKLNDYSEFMCLCRRFIIRVSSQRPAFIYYLGIFEIDKCCPDEYGVEIDGSQAVEATPSESPTKKYKMSCRGSNIKIESWNECRDLFTGETFFNGYKKVTNLSGQVTKLPREIKKTMSRNCKTLLVESYPTYLVEIWDYLPDWKMDEVSLQLQHEHILVNGQRLYFEEGTPAQIVEGVCQPMYTMKFVMRDCSVKQLFGCNDRCNPSPKDEREIFFAKPSAASYYSEDRLYVGDAIENLVAHLNSVSGVTDVEVLTKSIRVETTAAAPSFYAGGLKNTDYYYPYMTQEEAEYATDFVLCNKPVLGAVTVAELLCAAPVVGTISTESYGDTVIMPNEPFEYTGTVEYTEAPTIKTEYSIPLINGTIWVFLRNGVETTDYTFDETNGKVTLTGTSWAYGDTFKIFGSINSIIYG